MNRRSLTLVTVILVAAGLYWVSQAGSLEPPGPPGPTMVTLEDLDARIDDLTSAVAHPAYRLVGFSDLEFYGDGGVIAFTQACQDVFPRSRMCTSNEILLTVNYPAGPVLADPSDFTKPLGGWVRPTFVPISGPSSDNAASVIERSMNVPSPERSLPLRAASTIMAA